MNRYFAIAYGTISYALFLVLLFAAMTTAWILVAMQLEERDLLAALGARYAAYRETVPMLVPGLRKSSLASRPQR